MDWLVLTLLAVLSRAVYVVATKMMSRRIEASSLIIVRLTNRCVVCKCIEVDFAAGHSRADQFTDDCRYRMVPVNKRPMIRVEQSGCYAQHS